MQYSHTDVIPRDPKAAAALKLEQSLLGVAFAVGLQAQLLDRELCAVVAQG